MIIAAVFSTWMMYSQEFDLSFSHRSGVYEGEIEVAITGTFDKLYYTTNGTHPKHGKRYSTPLKIEKNTVLRVQPYYSGKRMDTTFLRSFLFDFKTKLPIVSIAIPDSSMWSSDRGIYAKGNNAVYNDSTKHWENCNFQKKWERAMHVEYIDTSGNVVFNQQAGIRIFGETTRRLSEKSMKIVAREEYGKNRFEGAVFPLKPHIVEHKQFVLRTSGNDYRGTRFKDCLNSYLIRDLGVDYMAYQPIQLFINGQYWGLYNLREKVNKHFLCYNHNAAFDSSSIIMGRWVRQHGNARDYMRMYRYFENLDTMDNSAYIKVKTMLDIRNYINYRVFQIFLNNSDSRGNIRYWNSRDLDGKFRMIFYDSDHSHGKYSRKFLEACLSDSRTYWFNPSWSTMYLTSLMEHDEFKAEFVNQFAHLLNTNLHYNTIDEAVDQFVNIYGDELPRDRNSLPRYFRNSALKESVWLEKVDQIRSFARLRAVHMRKEIDRLITHKGTYLLKVNSDSGFVVINGNTPVSLPYQGIYFKGVDLEVKVLQDKDWIFTGWSDGNEDTIRTFSGSKDTIEISPQFKLNVSVDTMNADSDLISDEEVQEVLSQSEQEYESWNFNNVLMYVAYGLIFIGLILISTYFLRRNRLAQPV